jgi:4-alpha-glucanotransferase
MTDTLSFQNLSQRDRGILEKLYLQYFFERQNELWFKSAQSKLDAIQHGSDMMICAEDLGMVPEMVEGVLKSREMLALQVERMPKVSDRSFSNPADAPYLSVVTPSTHDMSTIREWWEEDSAVTGKYFHEALGRKGNPPFYGEPDICEEIIRRHLQSKAMWTVFLLQDLLAIEKETRRENPAEDRINNPADPDHFWNYRMHLPIEKLMQLEEFSNKINTLIADSGR